MRSTSAGRHLAYERGAFLSSDIPEPITTSVPGGPDLATRPAPLYPLVEIARIDWASLFAVFPDWRQRQCN